MSRRVLIFIALVMVPCFLYGQKDQSIKEFKDYYNRNLNEFKEARAKANKEFVEYLAKAWEEFQVSRAKDDPVGLLPDEPTFYNGNISQTSSVHGYPCGLFAVPAPRPSAVPAIAAHSPADNYIRVDFFGIPENIPFSSDMRLSRINANENDVSKGWQKLSNSSYQETVDALLVLKEQLSLSDWAIYTTIKKITDAVYSDEFINQRVLTQMFLLSQMNYRVRTGAYGDELILLLPFDSPVYQVSYISDDGLDYYIYSYSRLNSSKPLYSFGDDFSMSDKSLSLVRNRSLSVGYDFYQLKELKLWEPYMGEKISLPINIPLVQFTLDYPQSDLLTYHKSAVDGELKKTLFKALRYKIIKDEMTAEQAVAFVLNLIQHGFVYKTDYEMFGRAKPLFVEESFFYGSNNCKDRVLIFSWIVRDLLGLDVLMLTYPGHVACAVNLGNNVKGDTFNYNGVKYVMCDPTYIGAPVGETMPKFKNVNPTIDKL